MYNYIIFSLLPFTFWRHEIWDYVLVVFFSLFSHSFFFPCPPLASELTAALASSSHSPLCFCPGALEMLAANVTLLSISPYLPSSSNLRAFSFSFEIVSMRRSNFANFVSFANCVCCVSSASSWNFSTSAVAAVAAVAAVVVWTFERQRWEKSF